MARDKAAKKANMKFIEEQQREENSGVPREESNPNKNTKPVQTAQIRHYPYSK